MSQNATPNSNHQALMKQALIELRDLRSKLNVLETAKTEPIAVIGMGCRFPGGANSPEAFWQLLSQGVDAITEVPPDRWDIDQLYDPNPSAPGKMSTRYGGFVSQLYEFDPHFFGLSPREAITLDPQQRLLLEVCWEALEHAGLPPQQLAGSSTGVFIGICSNDYSQILLNCGLEAIDAYVGTGNTHSVAAGRLSYLLGLQGPSFAVDTACSSSLVTVHLACQSIRNQECDVAVVGGVNRILTPEATINFSKASMLAIDGRCKTFDAKANGYVRGEGCGIVVLKRLSKAIADGDSILALIKGSAINQDGRSSGLTVPNGPAQQMLIRRALENSGIEPSQVSYIEAHGTGTALGDPIELGALGAVFGQGRTAEDPLVIGSVKTNIGHLEGAAGIAGLIKVVLSLQHQEIPPHLHFQQPNPHVDWQTLPVKIPTDRLPWPSGQRVAGVSSFGFSGTNAHVILAESPPVTPATVETTDRPLHLLTLSAKSATALQQLAHHYQQHLTTTDFAFENICFTANTGRSHFEHRLSVIAASTAQACEKLANWVEGQEALGVLSGRCFEERSDEVVFLFTGQGAQSAAMGRQLYETQPTFRRTLDRCDQILRAYLDQPLLKVLFDSDTTLLNQTAYTQPILFALEYALAQLWQSWGIQPTAVMGHSVGEYVAACVAGVFSLEDGLKLIAERGRLMQALPPGEMVAVLASEAQVVQAIQAEATQVAIAAINGPQSLVISGDRAAIQRACETLTADGVKTKPLTVSHAFHSPLMEPMLDAFAQVAETITYNPPQIEVIANLTGQFAIADQLTTPEYWCQHIRQPVRFADGMTALYQQGYDIFIEMGPKPVLLGMASQCLANSNRELTFLPSLRPGQADWQTLLESLGRLYTRGLAIDWFQFDRDYVRNKVTLPTYPFQRQVYRVDDAGRSQSSTGSETMTSTSILQWLQQGKTQQLTELLNQVGNFSEEQKSFVPQLLQTLVEQQQQQEVANTLQDGLYEVEWQPKTRESQSENSNIQQDEPGSWLILADPLGLGTAIANRLKQQGHECAIAYTGETYQLQENGVWQINPASPSDFEELLRAIGETHSLPLQGIVHLWSLAGDPVNLLDQTSLESHQKLGCGSTLHLIQSLTQSQLSAVPRLWLVTRGAMPVGSDLPAVAQAPVWGLGRVVSLEYPQYWGGMIDLSPESTVDETALLLAELQDAQGEDHLAFRGGQRYAARLVRRSIPSAPPITFRADGTYLITGGLGSLGLQVAQWMVKQGCRHLTLLSRGSASPQAETAIAQLREMGAIVRIAQADVADREDLAGVLQKIQAAGPSLAGVIHAAGVSQLQPISEIDLASLAAMLAAKVAGTWNLHSLTQDLALDCFICFSSIASVWGSKGLAHYAAANHFLDVFAHYRARSGLPALSINWGPWTEFGMATGETQSTWLNRRGLNGLSPNQAITALNHLLAAGCVQTTVAEVDWAVFKSLYEVTGPRSLLQQIDTPHAQVESTPLAPKVADPIWQELTELPIDQRQTRLMAHLQIEVGKVLGMVGTTLPEPHQGFFDMGMDSLMAVELKNHLETSLQKTLPATLVIEVPTLNGLVQYLAKEVLGWEDIVANGNQTSPTMVNTQLTEVEQLSEAAVDSQLEQELLELETLLMED
jgi:malonyl CoA-acyl carrier protein transacylase